MPFEMLFKLANTVALAAWLGLVLLPRRPALLAVLRYGVITLFIAAYATLAAMYFFRGTGGGSFATLAGVKALLSSDPGMLAGWLHYLAFDLFVGLWIAAEQDERRISRLMQAPVLVATFMLGPIGLLVAYAVKATGSRAAAIRAQP